MTLYDLLRKSNSDTSILTFEATVATGFEVVAFEECETLLNATDIVKHRGRVFFNAKITQLKSTFSLRSVDNLYIILNGIPSSKIAFGDNKEDAFKYLKELVHSTDWKKGINAWRDVFEFQGNCYPTKEEYQLAILDETKLKQDVLAMYNAKSGCVSQSQPSEEIADSPDENDTNLMKSKEKRRLDFQKFYQEIDKRNSVDKLIKFGVKCYRTGVHTFQSQEAAYHFGGELQSLFNWIVDLSFYDLEVVLNIKEDEIYTGIAITKRSLHHRNITHFGPTTLRATTCYALLQLANPKNGDIIMDPLCGGGSIPIEGLFIKPYTYCLAGDIHPLATARSINNIAELNCQRKGYVDVLNWNIKNLPLRNQSIDVVVSDLPFGKRMGCTYDNRVLYVDILKELSRVMRFGGRAVLLTHDKKNFIKAFAKVYGLWKMSRILMVNIGGLQAGVYVISRLCQSVYSPISVNTLLKIISKKS